MARPLNPEELRKSCDPKRFRFANTSEVASLTRIVGQARAPLDAIDFGLGMRSLGFNTHVLGESGKVVPAVHGSGFFPLRRRCRS